jgi:hypothetical protein
MIEQTHNAQSRNTVRDKKNGQFRQRCDFQGLSPNKNRIYKRKTIRRPLYEKKQKKIARKNLEDYGIKNLRHWELPVILAWRVALLEMNGQEEV